MLVIGLGHDAGNFAPDVGALRDLAQIVAPRHHRRLANARLGDMIDDKTLLGMTVHELDRVRQMAVENQNVVGQPVLIEQRNARR